MPTPSPSIVASVGAVRGISATCSSSVMTLSDDASPTIAVTIGNPIATTVPNVSEQDDEGDRQADRLARLGARPRQLLAEVAARLDLATPLDAPGRRARTAFPPRPIERLLGERRSASEMYPVVAFWLRNGFPCGVKRADRGDDIGIGLVCLVVRAIASAYPRIGEPARIPRAVRAAPIRSRCSGSGRPASRRRLSLFVPGSLKLSLVLSPARWESVTRRREDDEPGGDHKPAEPHAEPPDCVEGPRHVRDPNRTAAAPRAAHHARACGDIAAPDALDRTTRCERSEEPPEVKNNEARCRPGIQRPPTSSIIGRSCTGPSATTRSAGWPSGREVLRHAAVHRRADRCRARCGWS